MHEILIGLGAKTIGELLGRIIPAAAKSIEGSRKAPTSKLIQLRLSEAAEQYLPRSTPMSEREAVKSELVKMGEPLVVIATFEQIVEFNPTTQRVIAHGKKAAAKKSPAKRSAAKKAPAKKSAAKKSASKKATKRG